MKKLLMYVLIASMAIVSSCKKDDDSDVKQAPKVNAPSATEALVGTTVDLSFTYNAEDGFASSTVAATNGSAVIKTDGTEGATSGTIVVSFTAGNNAGAGSVTLSIADKSNRSDDATAVVNVVAEQSVFRINSNITENTTWESGKIYILETRIAVEAGATLTIQPGVIVKGEAGTGANATALLVARGAKLMAEGTADAPIIFTTVADEIIPGQIASPNLDPDLNGLWGGVIILGNARISASNESGDVSQVQIEGIPTSDPNGLYGGNNDADNSGVIKYISIRHGGTNIGAGNEINGLTLGGVGSGTVIENVEIVSNQDDGIEWFGGTVSVSNVVVWNTGDDAIDTDQSWAGTLNNFVIIAPGDHNFELDGPEGSYEAGHTIQNGIVIANDPELDRYSADLINVDANSIVTLRNIYFTAIVEGQKINRVNAAGVDFDNIMLNVPAANLVDYVAGDVVPNGVVAGGSSTVNTSVLGWTWASNAGALSGL
ncbi:MAG: hypothetical protein PHG67_04510 [Bacteroidales bacterium]|jgi:hypothetical protein|nr:hypothetical protein [Bacteroidales bacterium]